MSSADRLGLAARCRRVEVDDAAMAADVPLEAAVSRLLGREPGRAEAKGQRHGRD